MVIVKPLNKAKDFPLFPRATGNVVSGRHSHPLQQEGNARCPLQTWSGWNSPTDTEDPQDITLFPHHQPTRSPQPSPSTRLPTPWSESHGQFGSFEQKLPVPLAGPTLGALHQDHAPHRPLPPGRRQALPCAREGTCCSNEEGVVLRDSEEDGWASGYEW